MTDNWWIMRSVLLWDLREQSWLKLQNSAVITIKRKAVFICWSMDKRQWIPPFPNISLKVCAHKNHEKLERRNYWNFKYILHNLVCTKIQVKYKHKAMILLCKSVLWYATIYIYIKVTALSLDEINTRLNHYWPRAPRSTLDEFYTAAISPVPLKKK